MTLNDFARDASLFRSVMDVGCGMGDWLRKITAERVIGVDAHMPTLMAAQKRCPDATLICYDIRKLGEIFPPRSVDCLTAMDVIEHLSYDDACKVLEQFEVLASQRVMLFVPTGKHPQTEDLTGMGNAHWQTHRSTWYAHQLVDLGYEVQELPNFHKGTPGKDPGAVIAVKNVRS